MPGIDVVQRLDPARSRLQGQGVATTAAAQGLEGSYGPSESDQSAHEESGKHGLANSSPRPGHHQNLLFCRHVLGFWYRLSSRTSPFAPCAVFHRFVTVEARSGGQLRDLLP